MNHPSHEVTLASPEVSQGRTTAGINLEERDLSVGTHRSQQGERLLALYMPTTLGRGQMGPVVEAKWKVKDGGRGKVSQEACERLTPARAA